MQTVQFPPAQRNVVQIKNLQARNQHELIAEAQMEITTSNIKTPLMTDHNNMDGLEYHQDVGTGSNSSKNLLKDKSMRRKLNDLMHDLNSQRVSNDPSQEPQVVRRQMAQQTNIESLSNHYHMNKKNSKMETWTGTANTSVIDDASQQKDALSATTKKELETEPNQQQLNTTNPSDFMMVGRQTGNFRFSYYNKEKSELDDMLKQFRERKQRPFQVLDPKVKYEQEAGRLKRVSPIKITGIHTKRNTFHTLDPRSTQTHLSKPKFQLNVGFDGMRTQLNYAFTSKNMDSSSKQSGSVNAQSRSPSIDKNHFVKRSESVNVTNSDLDHITQLRIEELNQVVKQKNPFEQPLKEDSVKLQISNSSFNRSYLSPLKLSDQVNSSELQVLPQIKTVFIGDKRTSGIVLNHLADGYRSNNTSKHQIGLQDRATRAL